jgi:hypothetical protein
LKEQTQMNLFSIQTVFGNNFPKDKQKEIIDQLAVIFLHYFELLNQSDTKDSKEISHVS